MARSMINLDAQTPSLALSARPCLCCVACRGIACRDLRESRSAFTEGTTVVLLKSLVWTSKLSGHSPGGYTSVRAGDYSSGREKTCPDLMACPVHSKEVVRAAASPAGMPSETFQEVCTPYLISTQSKLFSIWEIRSESLTAEPAVPPQLLCGRRCGKIYCRQTEASLPVTMDSTLAPFHCLLE